MELIFLYDVFIRFCFDYDFSFGNEEKLVIVKDPPRQLVGEIITASQVVYVADVWIYIIKKCIYHIFILQQKKLYCQAK